jgi:ankyrin repeat protein
VNIQLFLASTSHTALSHAAETGHLCWFIQILDEWSDVNSLDMDGRNTLYLAAKHGWHDLVQALTRRNAEIDLH